MSFGIFLASASGGRLFGIDQYTFIMTAMHLINITVLFIILFRLLYKPVREFLQKRADRIRGQLEQAESDKTQAAELKMQYEQKIQDAGREREEIIDEARRVATEMSQRIVEEAKKEADAVRARAQANVEMEWDRAQETMRQAIIEVSAAMSEKFVALAINKETHDKLFDEAMAGLEGMTWKS